MMMEIPPPAPLSTEDDKSFVYYVLRYVPNLVRDEWVNIGVLVFDPRTNERRFRLIEDEDEFHRIRRLHPDADEGLLRALQGSLESRLEAANLASRNVSEWESILFKWDSQLSNSLQLAPPAGSLGADLDSEAERLYADRIAVPRLPKGVGLAGSRGYLRNYCAQVFRSAHLWDRLQKRVRAEIFTFPGDPMRLDYSYRRNGTRGFVQTLSVSRAPADAKLLAYTAKHILDKNQFASEFTAVTDVPLQSGNDRHRFVRETLKEFNIEPVPQEGFAVWVAKLRPMLLQ
jgi:hypothetical protein